MIDVNKSFDEKGYYVRNCCGKRMDIVKESEHYIVKCSVCSEELTVRFPLPKTNIKV